MAGTDSSTARDGDEEKILASTSPTGRIRDLASRTEVVIRSRSELPPSFDVPFPDDASDTPAPPPSTAPSERWRAWIAIAFILVGLAAILATIVALK